MALDGAQPGSPVRIRDLQSRPSLNGTIATLGDYKADKGRYAVVVPEGSTLLLKPDNLETAVGDDGKNADDDALELEDNDDSDDLALECNGGGEDSDGGDSLALEQNDGDGEEDDDELALEENAAVADDDEEELELEANDEDEDLELEANDDEEELELEANTDDDDDDELALECNEHGAGKGMEEEEEEELALEANSSSPLETPVAIEQIFTPGAQDAPAMSMDGHGASGGLSASVGVGGLEEALRALNPAAPGTLGVGVDGMPVEVTRFLIPSAKAALEQGLQMYPQRPGESAQDYQMRVLQTLTSSPAHCSQQTFTEAAVKIADAYGIDAIARHMRRVGDDHFAAGAFTAAAYAYTAGIEAHTESGDDAELMHTYVNRSAAFLKLGQTERAVEDADNALALSEAVYAPKTQRKALLRRATALLELGKREAAERDLDSLGPDDEAATRLRGKLATGHDKGRVV